MVKLGSRTSAKCIEIIEILREQELMEDVSTLKSGEYVLKTPDTVIECAMRHSDFHNEIDALQEIIEESWWSVAHQPFL